MAGFWSKAGDGVGWAGKSKQVIAVHLSEDGGGLEAGLCLSIDRFLDQLLPTVELPTSLFHLSLYRWLKFFTKESNEARFFWGPLEGWIGGVRGEKPNPVLPLVGTESLV